MSFSSVLSEVKLAIGEKYFSVLLHYTRKQDKMREKKGTGFNVKEKRNGSTGIYIYMYVTLLTEIQIGSC